MTDNLPARAAARGARRGRKFPPGAACVVCGFSNPVALVELGRTLLEEHHVLGRVNEDAPRVPACRNCHALITNDLMDAGASMKQQPSIFHKLVHAHRALAVYHRAMAHANDRFALELDEALSRLDDHLPDWRSVAGGS